MVPTGWNGDAPVRTLVTSARWASTGDVRIHRMRWTWSARSRLPPNPRPSSALMTAAGFRQRLVRRALSPRNLPPRRARAARSAGAGCRAAARDPPARRATPRARQAGAAGPSGAMDVILRHERQIEIDDERQLRDVETARGDVGGDEYVDAARLEVAERLVRAPWLLLPWITAALTPARSRYWPTRFEPCFVLQKTSAWPTGVSRQHVRQQHRPCADRPPDARDASRSSPRPGPPRRRRAAGRA